MPTQMIFSGAGMGMSQLKLPSGWVTARPVAALVSVGSASAAITSRRVGHCGKSGESATKPPSITAP